MTNTSITMTIARVMDVSGLEDLAPPADEVHEEEHRGDDEQDVNNAAGDIKGETDQPEQQQQDHQSPKHTFPSARMRGKRYASAYCRRRRCGAAGGSREIDGLPAASHAPVIIAAIAAIESL